RLKAEMGAQAVTTLFSPHLEGMPTERLCATAGEPRFYDAGRDLRGLLTRMLTSHRRAAGHLTRESHSAPTLALENQRVQSLENSDGFRVFFGLPARADQ